MEKMKISIIRTIKKTYKIQVFSQNGVLLNGIQNDKNEIQKNKQHPQVHSIISCSGSIVFTLLKWGKTSSITSLLLLQTSSD